MDRNYIIKITEIWGAVALRKESVDRNPRVVSLNYKEVVALRKESVDRNIVMVGLLMCSLCRSPQGERG